MKNMFTEKQMNFMRAYVVNQNATQAAIEAGYSKKTAYSQGQRLLKNVDIKTMVDTALARVAEKQQVRAEEVISHTRYVGLSNAFDYVQYDENGSPYFDLKEVQRRDKMLGAAISSIKITHDYHKGKIVRTKTELKLHDKKAALDKLDSATGAFLKHNKGMDEGKRNVIIHVNTGINGAPASNIRRKEFDVKQAIRDGYDD